MKDFFIKNGKLVVVGQAYAVSNENTTVTAIVPSTRKIRAAIRQEVKDTKKEYARDKWRGVPEFYIWNLSERVSQRVLPIGECPLWYRDFLTNRCYREIAGSTNLFTMVKDPARGYERKLTLKRGAKL